MIRTIIQWQEGSEGFSSFGPYSVLLAEDHEDFEAAAPYGYIRTVGEVDMDRMVLIDRGPRGIEKPKEHPVTIWTLGEQRTKRGIENASKEADRSASDAAAAQRPGSGGAKAFAAEMRKAEVRAIFEEIEAEKAR